MKIDIFRNLKLRYKIIFPLILVMLFLFTTILIATIYSVQKTLNYNTEKFIKAKIREVNSSIEQISNIALYIASISSEMRIVQDAYKEYYKTGDLNKASNIIDDQFEKINDIIFKSSGYEPRIHFHLPPAISFCRCWSEVRGDDISGFRNSILKVSKEHTFVKGIETGRAGFVIRGIAPIFSANEEYYGSVEAFFNIDILLNSVDKKADEEFAIFMNTDLLKIATNFLEDTSSNIKSGKQIIGDYILVDKTEKFQLENIIKQKLNFNISENKVFQYSNYSYAIIPIKNISQKIEGIGILQINISDQQKSMKNIIIFEIIVSILLLIIVIILLSNISYHYIVKRIIKTDLLLQKLSKGELIEETTVYYNDEICSMLNSLNKLNENITTNTNFAIQIGKDNFNIEYIPISKNDLLGNALLLMQKNLILYSEKIKSALEKIIKSEENFKNLSNLTFEGILIHDKGIAIDLNLSLANMFGYTQKELLGKNLIEVLVPVEYHKFISENIIKNIALPYEVEGIHKDGSLFPIELEAKNIAQKNSAKIISVFAIRDISRRRNAENALKESEEKYRNLYEYASDAIATLDTKGVCINCNDATMSIFQLAKNEIVGKSIFEFVPNLQPDGSNSKEKVNDLLSHAINGLPQKFEFVQLKNKNTPFIADISVNKINIRGKDFLQAIFRDITEKKHMEKIVLNAIIETEEKEKKKFAEDLHDELGPYLSGIKLFVNLLAKKKINYNERIKMVGELEEMIDESIYKTKLISNSLMPNVLMDFGLIKALKSFVKKINLTKRLHIDYTYDFDNIKLDPVIEIVIYRVVLELINNTIKHANASSISLEIEIKKKLALKYSDNGIGYNLGEELEKGKGNGLVNIINRLNSLDTTHSFNSKPNEGMSLSVEVIL